MLNFKQIKPVFVFSSILFILGCRTNKIVFKENKLDYDNKTLASESSPYLMPYNRIIDGAGESVNFGDPDFENHSLDLALIPESNLVVVEDRYGLAVFDMQSHKLISRWTYNDFDDLKSTMSSFSGVKVIEWQHEIHIFWGAGARNKPDSYVFQAVWNGTEIKLRNTFVFKPLAPATIALPNEVALLKEGNELYLFTVLNGNNRIEKLKVSNGSLIWSKPTGNAPYGLRIVKGKAFVSNWAGPLANASEEQETAGIPWGNAYVDPKTGAISKGSVSVYDINDGKLLNEIKVGLHPNALISSPDEKTIFVANGNSDNISIIDVERLFVRDSVFVGLFAENKNLVGSTPNGLAISENGEKLYVANGLDNAVAVISLNTNTGINQVEGFIPTQAYPSGIVIQDYNLIITNLEAIGARAAHKVEGSEKAYNSHKQLASISFIQIPDKVKLAEYTQKVKDLSLYYKSKLAAILPRPEVTPKPVPERIGEPSVFKHILYIIKENRTYDQVLGDMSEGDGMPSLCIFGDSVTPNQHKIAREYLLMDNYYVSGKASAEGHHWASAGMVTDYTEKSVRAWFRSYPHVLYDALVYNKNGLIWNNALDHGKTARIYGEACTCEYDKTQFNWTSLKNLQENGETFPFENTSTISRVRPILSKEFPGCDDENISDQMRADAFLKELEFWNNNESEKMPHLMVMSLPNDHTTGMNPNFPTPRAMVADNDLAVGRIVEAVMKSRFADSTVIFISEDDSQAGWDHVSAYRTTGFVVSKYSRLQKTIRTNYNQTSLLRTIEQILGLPPMNIIDATATPMFDCFSNEKNTDYTFTSRKNLIALDEMNPPAKSQKGAALKFTNQSIKYVFDRIDRGKDDILNRIIWFSSNSTKPYPAKFAGEDDDDDEE